MSLKTETIGKLKKLFPMLSSNHDGEVIAAVKAIQRVLDKEGASLHDITSALGGGRDRVVYKNRIVYRDRIVEKVVYKEAPSPTPPPPPPRENKINKVDHVRIIRLCEVLLTERHITEREFTFINSLSIRAQRYKERFNLTDRQIDWFDAIVKAHKADE